LQIGGPEETTSPDVTDLQIVNRRAQALDDAVQHLVDVGLVDKSRVGIMGHSATGRVVEDALAFTDFPFAAAIAADNEENNYSHSMEEGWDHEDGTSAAFGAGLSDLLNSSPAFSVERIRTPLQLEVTSGGSGGWPMLRGWEMFSRLRYLRKPVEYYVLPDIAHGSHYVQNPRQLLALQNRALDWWRFWLQSEEDHAVDKLPQYQDWRLLRTMHIEDLTRPRLPRRTWTSTQ
jgi:acetyl esterase/lipase